MPMQAIHALQTEQMAAENCDPTKASRPFDKSRTEWLPAKGGHDSSGRTVVGEDARRDYLRRGVGLGSANVRTRICVVRATWHSSGR